MEKRENDFLKFTNSPGKRQSFKVRNLLDGVAEGGRWDWIIGVGSDNGVPRMPG